MVGEIASAAPSFPKTVAEVIDGNWLWQKDGSFAPDEKVVILILCRLLELERAVAEREEAAMPSKTPKQQRFMAMCSTTKGRAKARGKCPPRKVAEEFKELDRTKPKKGSDRV